MCTFNTARLGWLLAHICTAATHRAFESDHMGSCGATKDGAEGDCANGDRGSWPLNGTATVTAGLHLAAKSSRQRAAAESKAWDLAVSQCAARCQSCSRCAFVSISVRHRACMWFRETACDLEHLLQERNGFRTYRVPAGIPSACVQKPEEGAFAMVLDKLSQLPATAMRNSSVLADLAREVGLVHDPVRPLYGSEKIHMHSRGGFGMYQLPEQLGCLLSELASMPTRVRTFVEVGSWYGWTGLFTGLFFSNYARRLNPAQGFRSASFDIYDLRSPCVKALMARHGHGFHRIPSGRRLHRGSNSKLRPRASRWQWRGMARLWRSPISPRPRQQRGPPRLTCASSMPSTASRRCERTCGSSSRGAASCCSTISWTAMRMACGQSGTG